MQRTGALIITLLSFTLCGQQPTPNPTSIAGIVKNAATGAAIAGVSVTAITNVRMTNNVLGESASTKQLTATTDSQGRYAFNDIPIAAPDGQCRLIARIAPPGRRGAAGLRTVSLKAGQHISLDIPIEIPGTVSGKVIDENGEAVADANVFLVGREYYAGALRSLFKSTARTNDRGEYTLDYVTPGGPL